MSGAERVLVVGAAGFGRESLDVLDAMVAAGEPVEIVGVLDDGPSEMNLARLADRGVTYLGTIDDWLTPSASASRLLAEPRRAGFCWLSCGAQPARCTISKVAGIRPSTSAPTRLLMRL